MFDFHGSVQSLWARLRRNPGLRVAAGLSLACPAFTSGVHAAEAFKWGTVVMGGGGFVSGIIASKTEKNVIYARTDVGGAYRWDEPAQGWIPITDWLGPNDMGLLGIDGLAIDPSTPGRLYMLAGTDYWNQGKTMILRSSDYGETFDTVNVTAQFKTHGNGYGRQNGERLAVDPNQPNVLLCGTRAGGLWKSENKGSTWAQVSGFAKPAAGDGVGFVLFDKTRSAGGLTQRIVVGTLNAGTNLFLSEDAGKTWEAIALPALSKQLMPQRAVLTPKGRYLYVTMANGSGPGFGSGTTISRGAVLKYDLDGKAWENISPENSLDDPPDPAHPGQTLWDAHLGGFGGLSMDAADSNHIIVASINNWKPQIWELSGKPAWGDKFFVSNDGGKTWKSLFGDLTDAQIAGIASDAPIAVLGKNGFDWIEGQSIHWAGSVEFDPFNPKRVFATSGNGIYMADNLAPGQRFKWNFCVRGLEETVPLDLISIPGGPVISVIGDYDGFVHRNISRPPLKRHTPPIGSTSGVDFARQKANVVVRVGGNDKTADNSEYVFPLYYSTDTGDTWTKFATHPVPGQNYRGKIAVSADGGAVVWNPEGKNTLYRTADWGATWTTSAGASGMNLRPISDPVNPNVFYAFGNGLLKSTDKGATFAKVDNSNFSSTTDLQATPGKEGHLWVTGYAYDGINGGYLARSTDGGKTFVKIDPAENPAYTQRIQHCEAVGFGKAATGAAYPTIFMYGTIAGALGMYQSVDEAKTWTRIDDAKHKFGALANGGFVRGDANTFGVVYRSTAGRGVAAYMPASWAVGLRPDARTPSRAVFPWSLTGPSLRLTVAPGAAVSVEVRDMRGRLLAARTATSENAPLLGDWVERSGTYVVRLSLPNGAAQQSLVLPILK